MAAPQLTRRDLLLVVLVAAVASVAYLVPPGVASGLDYVAWHVFNRQYWLDAVRELRVPLWNPHVALGRPFLADIEAAALYPGTLSYLLGPHAGLFLSVFLHAALAAAGMRLLAARLGVGFGPAALMAIAFVMGPLGSRLLVGQTGYVDATCYLPLAFALAMGVQDAPSARAVALLALTLGLQVLAGHPQMGWITWLGLALFIVGRRLHAPSRVALAGVGRDLALLATSIVWGLATAAALVLPFAEFVGQGNRGQSSLAFASSFALPPAGLHMLLVGHERSLYEVLGGWENDLYPGALAAVGGIAALAAVRRRETTGLLVVVIVSLLLAVGRRSPLFVLAYHLLPGLGNFRFAARIAGLASFALIVLTGLYLSQPPPQRAGRRAVVATAAALATGLALWLPWLDGLGVTPGWLATRLALYAGAGAALWWWAGAGRESRWCFPALLLVLCVDAALMLRTRRELAAAEGQGLVPAEEARLAGVLRSPELRQVGGAPARVLAPDTVVRENAGMALGFSAPVGYSAVAVDRVWTFVHESIGVRLPLHNTFPSSEIFARPFPYDTMNLVIGFDAGRRTLVRARASDPRAYLTSCAARVANWREAVRRVAEGHDVHGCALVEPGAAVPERLAGGRARITSFAPERVALQVEAEGESVLVLGEAWYPGWQARIGGRALPTFPVNAWMRGAVVPPGANEVVFSYSSQQLRAGVAVSVLSVLLALAMLRRRPGPSARSLQLSSRAALAPRRSGT